MLRSLVEQLSRGRVLRRRLPIEFGKRPIYLSPDSALSYLKPNWAYGSRDLFTAVRKYVLPSDNVWDIGGNVGVFTLAAAHAIGKEGEVVTVEADPFLASLLQKSATNKRNCDRQINIICAAVSNKIGMARFMVANRGRSSNSLEQSGHRSQAGGTRYVQHVPTLTLDSLLDHFLPPNVVKVDVEGAENLVLKGATRVLREARPRFYIEVGSEQNAEVASTFKSFNYRLYDGDANDGAEQQQCSFNTLAVPDEQDFSNKSV